MEKCSKANHAGRNGNSYEKYLNGRNVVRFFRTNEACNDYNRKCALELADDCGKPVAHIKAVNHKVTEPRKGHEKSYTELTQSAMDKVRKQHGPQLACEVSIVRGMKGMLDATLWKEAGLVKNAIGTVILIAGEDGKGDKSSCVADFVVCHIPTYCGPVWPGASSLSHLLADGQLPDHLVPIGSEDMN